MLSWARVSRYPDNAKICKYSSKEKYTCCIAFNHFFGFSWVLVVTSRLVYRSRCAPGLSKSDTRRQTSPRSRQKCKKEAKYTSCIAFKRFFGFLYTCDERFPGFSRSASCPAPRDRTTESEENRVQDFAHSCQGIESKFCSLYRSLNLLLCTVMPRKRS